MSVYQGLGRYRHESGKEFLIVFDERRIKPNCGTLPLLGYHDPRHPLWFRPEQFTQYLGPLIPPAPPLPTPEQLKDLPACCHGLGWYYSRLGELCQVLADLLGRRTSPGRSVVAHNCCSGMLSWLTTSGYVETDGSHHHGDLVYFVGPDKPEQETYAEFYAAHKPRVPREWWIVLQGTKESLAYQCGQEWAIGRFEQVHVREVLE